MKDNLDKARNKAREELLRGLDQKTADRLAEYQRILNSPPPWKLTIDLSDWARLLELQERERQRRQNDRLTQT